MVLVDVKKVLLSILLFFFCFCYSQTYTNYILRNIGQISIPSTLELRSGNFSKLMEPVKQKIEKQYRIQINDDRIVFQQKGLNQFSEKGTSDYVRVIIETDYASPGSYEKSASTMTLNQAEIAELNNVMKNQIEQSFAGTGLKLIKWNGVSVNRINGQIFLKFSYVRQLNNNPNVVVNIYQFHNNDRAYTITTSFRQTQASQWIPAMNKVIGSFIITNKR